MLVSVTTGHTNRTIKRERSLHEGRDAVRGIETGERV